VDVPRSSLSSGTQSGHSTLHAAGRGLGAKAGMDGLSESMCLVVGLLENLAGCIRPVNGPLWPTPR
jgi:hypothetical protein